MGAVMGWLSVPVVVIGWLVTSSEESRKFLKANFQISSYIAIGISFGLFVGLSRNYGVSSRNHQKFHKKVIILCPLLSLFPQAKEE